MPSNQQMERAASPATSVPAFQGIVTQGSSHHLQQVRYQHLCLLTTNNRRDAKLFLPWDIMAGWQHHLPTAAFCERLSSSPASPPPFSTTQQLGELSCLGLPALSPAERPVLSAKHVELQCHSPGSSDVPLELTASFRSSELIRQSFWKENDSSWLLWALLGCIKLLQVRAEELFKSNCSSFLSSISVQV